MDEKKKLSIPNKVLAFSAVTGCCGGLFIGMAGRLSADMTVMHSALRFIILLVIGMITGILAERLYKSNKNIFLTKDENGYFYFFKQRIFLLFIFIAAASWFFDSGFDIKPRIVSAVMSSVIFIIGLACGMYGQFGHSAKRMLLAGMIPLGASIIFLVIDSPAGIRAIVWILGFVYLMCSFVFMNNMQLLSNVFMSQEINIKSVRKIRRLNFLMAAILSVVCTGFILFSRVLLFARDTIRKSLDAIYFNLTKFSRWITYDLWYREMPDHQKDLPREWAKSDVPFQIVKILMVIAVLTVLTAIILTVIKALSARKGGKPGRLKINENAEYMEETEIIRDRIRLSHKRKNRYTTEGLRKIADPSGKTRYLYGFILERLYLRKVKIKPSFTPGEICTKALSCRGGAGLAGIGFEEFTEIYRNVRYGGKKVRLSTDPVEMAAVYEKIISEMNP